MASAAANPDPIPTTSIREQDELLEAIFRAHAAYAAWSPAEVDTRPGGRRRSRQRVIHPPRGGDPGGPRPLDPPAWLHRVAMNLVVSRARRNTVASRALPGLLDRDVARSPEDEVVGRERDDGRPRGAGDAGWPGPDDRGHGRARLPSRGDRRDHRQVGPGDANPAVPGAEPAPVSTRGRRRRVVTRVGVATVAAPRQRVGAAGAPIIAGSWMPLAARRSSRGRRSSTGSLRPLRGPPPARRGR